MHYAAALMAAGILSLSLLAAVVMPQPLASQVHVAPPEETRQAHHHRSPGKPGADVTLVSPGIRTLLLGDTQTLELLIQSHHRHGTLHVRVEPSQELQMLSDARQWSFALSDQEVLALPLTLQALAEGLHYLHVFIEHIDPDGTHSTRALATEFRTADHVQAPAYAKSLRAGTANPYRALPVSEEIY